MTIAVNCRLKENEQPEGYEAFMFGMLQHLAAHYPQHQFVFIFDKAFSDNIQFAKNVVPVVAGPETTNNLRLQYWLNYKIPVILRRHKADVFVSLEGICSMRTKKPQCVLVSDLGFLQSSAPAKKINSRFYKKYTSAFLTKATSIAAVSAFTKSTLIAQYNLNEDDVTLIVPGVDDIFKPIDWQEKEIVKEKYSDGKAYFLYSGNVNKQNNLINLLKAFSFFKRRQKSNMTLLLAGNTDEAFKNELKSYKYRDDVKLMQNLSAEALAKITAAAYAAVYPVLYADFAVAPMQAMQCGVPVVTSNTGALSSICGYAALYANPDDFNDIAEKMMLVFKDEAKANELIEAGKIQSQRYNWQNSTQMLMELIDKAFNA